MRGDCKPNLQIVNAFPVRPRSCVECGLEIAENMLRKIGPQRYCLDLGLVFPCVLAGCIVFSEYKQNANLGLIVICLVSKEIFAAEQ